MTGHDRTFSCSQLYQVARRSSSENIRGSVAFPNVRPSCIQCPKERPGIVGVVTRRIPHNAGLPSNGAVMNGIVKRHLQFAWHVPWVFAGPKGSELVPSATRVSRIHQFMAGRSRWRIPVLQCRMYCNG